MKKIIISLLSILIISSHIFTVNAKIDNNNLYSSYYYAYDINASKELYSKGAKTKIYPASMTKILTLYTALPLIKDLNAKVTILKEDIDKVWENDASAAGFAEGEEVTYKDLLYGVLYPSGADACWALGRLLAGDEEKFVAKMNQVAKKIGMKDSHFVTSTGLHDENHYTTVSDISLLLKTALKDKKFKSIFTDKPTYTSSNKRIVMLSTLERMRLRSKVTASTLIMGAKSGYTSEANHTLASYAKIKGRDIIIVVADSNASKFGVEKFNAVCSLIDTNTIVNDINNNYKVYSLIKKGHEIKKIKVKKGVKSSLTLVSNGINVFKTKDFNKNKVKYEYHIPSSMSAPIKKGQKIGYVNIVYNNKVIAKETYYAKETIKYSYIKSILNILKYIIYTLIIILILLRVRVIIRRNRRKKRRRYKRA